MSSGFDPLSGPLVFGEQDKVTIELSGHVSTSYASMHDLQFNMICFAAGPG
jgi:hypothetical protein